MHRPQPIISRATNYTEPKTCEAISHKREQERTLGVKCPRCHKVEGEQGVAFSRETWRVYCDWVKKHKTIEPGSEWWSKYARGRVLDAKQVFEARWKELDTAYEAGWRSADVYHGYYREETGQETREEIVDILWEKLVYEPYMVFVAAEEKRLAGVE